MTPKIASKSYGIRPVLQSFGMLSKKSFGVMNRSMVIFLTGELQKTKKWSMSINEYLNVVKQLADNLEVTGKAITHIDLVTQVLVGLDEDYTPIVVQINSRKHVL
ncbi:Retrovirus-related Pol polyprotein from transposon TNT 1-94 [Abeliophyllum distichum]|uniref:Retrovirus-related Pol polyprotein from transposon TNT 1-94 n=1 Tax=Abeliophyllum distichum TaxID=126358 RepID=A0ABD1T1Q5_9LAMI